MISDLVSNARTKSNLPETTYNDLEAVVRLVWRKLSQKLLLNQKCMGYLVRAYYSISPTRCYKDDSWWSADLKSNEKQILENFDMTRNQRPLKTSSALEASWKLLFLIIMYLLGKYYNTSDPLLNEKKGVCFSALYLKKKRNLLVFDHSHQQESYFPMLVQSFSGSTHSSSSSKVQAHILHQGVVARPYFEDNPFAQADNDPFINVFALEPSSEETSSGDVSIAEEYFQEPSSKDPNLVSSSPCVPPSKKDYDIQYQPLFEEHFEPL
nr:hypothetical protein [Tanacetum cinerariifolium]